MRNLQETQKKFFGLILSLALSGLLFTNQAQKAAFSLPSIDGAEVTAQNLRGKVVVLAFGSKTNPLDRALLPQLQKLQNRYGSEVVVAWVTTDSDRPNTRNFADNNQLSAFARRANFSGLVLRDNDGVLLRKLGITQLPTIVLVDKTGNLISPFFAGLDPDSPDAIAEVNAKIEMLLK